jgi:hypothetical protein
MAIKGKSRTKSRPKQVARAPRHEPVVVKPPVLARRWVQVTAAMLVGAFAIMVAVWATNGLRQDKANKDAAAAASTARTGKLAAGQAWQGSVTGVMSQLGTPNPTLSPVLFTAMNATIDTMKKKDTVPKGAAKVFQSALTDAKKAVSDLTNFDLTTTIQGKGFNVGEAEYFTDSKDRLTAAIGAYQRAAETALLAARAPAAERKALTVIADELRSDANAQFQTGWTTYESAMGAAGIAPSPNNGGSSGLGQ